MIAACAARPSAPPPQVDVPSASPSDASAPPLRDAGEEADAPAVIPARASKIDPWCDAQYANTPCAFRAYGLCYKRWKNCTNLPCTEAAPSLTSCPQGDAPAFMAKARACGRQATDPVVPKKTGWAAVPPECDGILTIWSNVPTDDRACRVDADCLDVVGSCFHATLNVKASKKATYAKTPCSSPGGGACADGAVPVRCESGCCVEQGGGFGNHAEVPFAAAP
jgi:hypothetical protein